MPVRNAQADWEGSLKEGKGEMRFGSGAYQGTYTWASRFEEGTGTNPEELLGAAHAGCYAMALSGGLGKAGFTPRHISVNAQVTLGRVEGKARITDIHLDVEADVPGIDPSQFQEITEETKSGCPVSAALTGVNITLSARLL